MSHTRTMAGIRPHIISLLMLSAATLAISGCKTTSPLTAQDTGNYPENIHTIISGNCLGGNCHSEANDLNDSLDLTSWDQMMGTGTIQEVIPYWGITSHLFAHINTDLSVDASASPTMPPGTPLSLSDQHTIRSWIDQGAKSFSGELHYATVTDRLFVLHPEEDLLSVIDRKLDRLAREYQVGNNVVDGEVSLGASGMAISPDRSKLYVSLSSGSIRVFDAKTYQQVGSMALGQPAMSVTILPDNTKAYVINGGNNDPHSLTVFDPKTMTVLHQITSPQIIGATSITLNRDGSRAYLVCAGSDDIKIINTATDAIENNVCCSPSVPQPIPTGYQPQFKPQEAVLSSDETKLYVTLRSSREVVEVDLTRDSVIRRVASPGYSPYGIALTPDGSELWISNKNSDNVNALSSATLAITGEVDSLANAPGDLAISPDGATIYVTCELLADGGHHHSSSGGPPSAIFVIDRATRTLRNTLEMPPLASTLLIP